MASPQPWCSFMDEQEFEAAVEYVLETCPEIDFIELMRLALASWAGKMNAKMQPRGASMEKEVFHEVVKFARICLERSPMGKRTPGEAQLAAYDRPDDEDSFVKGALIAQSGTKRWAWDATVAMAVEWLRGEARIPRKETLPSIQHSYLANWTADVLAGKRKRPSKDGTRVANRNICIAEAVYVLTLVFDINPTRNNSKRRQRLPECCPEGGSACDVVGEAQGLNYKTAEKAWTSYGELVSERLHGKDAVEILIGWGSESRLSYSKSENK